MAGHQPDTVLQEVRVHLAASQGSEAVRAFLSGIDDGVLNRDLTRPAALVRTIGKADAQKLLEAFAVWACPYCRGGVEKCEACAGRGSTSGDEDVCEACAGLGVSGCDFCAGSGWVSFNAVPERLRVHVAAIRVHRAASGIKSLAAEAQASEADGSFTRTAQRLLSLNRLAGALENALVLTNATPAEAAKPVVARLRQSCRTLGREALRLVVSTLEKLAQLAKSRSASLAGSPHEALASHKAAYYAALASPAGLARCRSLDHPFLWPQAALRSDDPHQTTGRSA